VFALATAVMLRPAPSTISESMPQNLGDSVLITWIMHWGAHALTTWSNIFTNLNLTDMETGYKAFRREVIQSIRLEEDRFGFEPEITAKVAQGGWVVYEVGISYSGRTYADGKKIGWRDGFHAVTCILKYSKPLAKLRYRLVR
jgi:hypothetical protein